MHAWWLARRSSGLSPVSVLMEPVTVPPGGNAVSLCLAVYTENTRGKPPSAPKAVLMV